MAGGVQLTDVRGEADAPGECVTESCKGIPPRLSADTCDSRRRADARELNTGEVGFSTAVGTFPWNRNRQL